MTSSQFMDCFISATRERLSQGDGIDGVLIGPDARRGLAEHISDMPMVKDKSPMFQFKPPYEMGCFMGHRIGSMEPNGIAVIKARPSSKLWELPDNPEP